MKIIVCVKAVSGQLTEPNLSDTASLTLNPYDSFILNKLSQKVTSHDSVTCLCMGPPRARTVLERSLAMGAHYAVLLSDSRFSGSDTFATSAVLSAAIKRLTYDIVICGHEAVGR